MVVLNVSSYWVKSGNFGHQVNSDIRLQTVEIQMRRLLIAGFSLFALLIYFYSSKQRMKLEESLSEFT